MHCVVAAIIIRLFHPLSLSFSLSFPPKLWRLNFPFLSLKSFDAHSFLSLLPLPLFTQCRFSVNIHFDFAVYCRLSLKAWINWRFLSNTVAHCFFFVFSVPLFLITKILCVREIHETNFISFKCHRFLSLSLSLLLSLVPSSHGFVQKTSRSSIRKVTINWLVSRNNIPHFGRERFFLYISVETFILFSIVSVLCCALRGWIVLLIFNFRNENVFFEWNRYGTNWWTPPLCFRSILFWNEFFIIIHYCLLCLHDSFIWNFFFRAFSWTGDALRAPCVPHCLNATILRLYNIAYDSNAFYRFIFNLFLSFAFMFRRHISFMYFVRFNFR